MTRSSRWLVGVLLLAAVGGLPGMGHPDDSLARRLRAALEARFERAVVRAARTVGGEVRMSAQVLLREELGDGNRTARDELDRLRREVLWPTGIRDFAPGSRLRLLGPREGASRGSGGEQEGLRSLATDLVRVSTLAGVSVEHLELELRGSREVTVHLDGGVEGGGDPEIRESTLRQQLARLVRRHLPGRSLAREGTALHLGGHGPGHPHEHEGHEHHHEHEGHAHAHEGHDHHAGAHEHEGHERHSSAHEHHDHDHDGHHHEHEGHERHSSAHEHHDHDHEGHDHAARAPRVVSRAEAAEAWDDF